MKHKVFFYTALLLSLSCTQNNQEESIYFQGTFDEVLELANEENKLIFLDFYTVWCGGCKSYDRFVFSDSIVQEYLKANFVFKSVDAEKGEGIDLKDQFEVAAYPTLIIADAKGDEIGRMVGFELDFMDSVSLFIDQVENVVNGIGTLRSMEQQYEDEPNNSDLIHDLIEAYKDHGKYLEIERIAKNMISSKDSLIQLEGHFNYAVSWIYRNLDANPDVMKSFLATKVDSTNDLYFFALDYVLNYYRRRNVTDSITYYYEVILRSATDAWYQKKQYAQFLFENNINLARAKDLAIEYSSLPYPYSEDYKQQLLLAYVKVYEGNTENCLDHYDDWMEDFTSKYTIEDTYWAHHYYADFANRFNLNLDQALAYITAAEEHSGRLTDMILRGEILYKLNKNTEAEKIMNEALAIVNNESQYEQIISLIEYYK